MKYDYIVSLTHDEYMDIMKNLDRSKYTGFIDDRHAEVSINGKVVLMRFTPGCDDIAFPPDSNPEQTYYQVADIPEDCKAMPRPVHQLKFDSPQKLQAFLDEIGVGHSKLT